MVNKKIDEFEKFEMFQKQSHPTLEKFQKQKQKVEKEIIDELSLFFEDNIQNQIKSLIELGYNVNNIQFEGDEYWFKIKFKNNKSDILIPFGTSFSNDNKEIHNIVEKIKLWDELNKKVFHIERNIGQRTLEMKFLIDGYKLTNLCEDDEIIYKIYIKHNDEFDTTYREHCFKVCLNYRGLSDNDVREHLECLFENEK